MNNPQEYPNKPKPEEIPTRDPSKMQSNTSNTTPYESSSSISSMRGSMNTDSYESWQDRLMRLEIDFQRSVQDSSNDPFWTQAWESFKEKSAQLRQQFSHVQNQLPAAWEKMKRGIQESVEELEEGYKRAKSEFEKRPSTTRR